MTVGRKGSTMPLPGPSASAACSGAAACPRTAPLAAPMPLRRPISTSPGGCALRAAPSFAPLRAHDIIVVNETPKYPQIPWK